MSLLSLSQNSQDEVGQYARDAATAQKKKGLSKLKGTLALAAVAGGLLLTTPMTGAPLLIAIIAGGFGIATGGFSAGNFVAANRLHKAAKEAGSEGFLDKVRIKVSDLGDRDKQAEMLGKFSMWAFIVSTALGALFPMLAPVTVPVSLLTASTWSVGSFAHSLLGASVTALQGLETAVFSTDRHNSRVPASANDEAPSTLVQAPAPAAAFSKAMLPVQDEVVAKKEKELSIYKL